MELTKLNIGTDAPKTVATTIKFEPMNGKKPFLNGNGDPLSLNLLALNSPEGGREFRKWRKKFGDDTDYSEATEEELEAAIDRDAESGSEFLARMTAGWNLSDGGKSVPCTMANKIAFYEAFELVAVAVSNEITRIGKELGNSKTR